MSDSTSSAGDGDESKYAGNGGGVNGPVQASESAVDSSSEGGASDAEPLFVKTLAQMNRVVLIGASGAPLSDSCDERELFLVSAIVAIEVRLEGSDIRPWQSRAGVGGKVCRSCGMQALVVCIEVRRALLSLSNP